MYIGIEKNETTYLIEITDIKEYINYRDITKDKVVLISDREMENFKNSNKKIVISGKE